MTGFIFYAKVLAYEKKEREISQRKRNSLAGGGETIPLPRCPAGGKEREEKMKSLRKRMEKPWVMWAQGE